MGYLIPRSQSVTLDSSGAGTVSFSIDNTNQRWSVDAVHVETTQALSAIPVPQARTFRNGVAQGGTNSGNFDTAAGRVDLYDGDVLAVTWAGGIPGTVATAVIGGWFDPAGVPLRDV